MTGFRNLLATMLLGLMLTVLFWTRLWQGGGFIGGDTYTYFLPQKAFLADRLRAGEFPLWNSLAGHGYPLLAESQTAPLYPLNPCLYGWLDLNTAYVASHLLHYVAAFCAMTLLARRLGLGFWGAALAAVVYVYGWFPPRACLEWAIIGGVYLPLAIYCVEGWFQTNARRYLVGLSGVIGLDLLAGHFNLAFITTLATCAYSLARGGLKSSADLRASPRTPLDSDAPPDRSTALWRWLAPLICLGLGYGLAAPQLLPSWNLKQVSQRTELNEEFDPGYGHLPPWYLCQVATPWLWFSSDADPDRALNTITFGAIPSATNKVEAHLYFGLLPLCLAVYTLFRSRWRGIRVDPRLKIIAWIGLFGVVYATGWLLPVLHHLPGFGFFRGPGRYGILTTLAVALLSGAALSNPSPFPLRGHRVQAAIKVCILMVTVLDLYWVSRHQWYTFTTTQPIVDRRNESDVRRLILDEIPDGTARMLALGPNLATLTGLAASPPYLGFGPDAYYLPGGRLPDPRFLQFLSGDPPVADIDLEEQFNWLRQAGVTHILSMRRLPGEWPIERIWTGFDPLLNPAWARGPHEPLFLYRVTDAPGRLFLSPDHDAGVCRFDEYRANRVIVTVTCDRPTTLVLTDLPWQEWELTLNGVQHATEPSGANPAWPVQRRVSLAPGRYRLIWTYRPVSLYVGLSIAAVAMLSLFALGWLTRRRGRREADATSSSE